MHLSHQLIDHKSSIQLFVGNIPQSCTQSDLQLYFSTFVDQPRVSNNKNKGLKTKRTAVLQIRGEDSLNTLLSEPRILWGHKLTFQPFITREKKSQKNKDLSSYSVEIEISNAVHTLRYIWSIVWQFGECRVHVSKMDELSGMPKRLIVDFNTKRAAESLQDTEFISLPNSSIQILSSKCKNPITGVMQNPHVIREQAPPIEFKSSHRSNIVEKVIRSLDHIDSPDFIRINIESEESNNLRIIKDKNLLNIGEKNSNLANNKFLQNTRKNEPKGSIPCLEEIDCANWEYQQQKIY